MRDIVLKKSSLAEVGSFALLSRIESAVLKFEINITNDGTYEVGKSIAVLESQKSFGPMPSDVPVVISKLACPILVSSMLVTATLKFNGSVYMLTGTDYVLLV